MSIVGITMVDGMSWFSSIVSATDVKLIIVVIVMAVKRIFIVSPMEGEGYRRGQRDEQWVDTSLHYSLQE